MTENDYDSFVKELLGVCEVLPPYTPLSAAGIMVYWNILKKYEFDFVQAGIQDFAQDKETIFRPTPPDLIRVIEKIIARRIRLKELEKEKQISDKYMAKAELEMQESLKQIEHKSKEQIETEIEELARSKK